MKAKLIDITKVIRSKNSGPYEITFDIIFKDKETFYWMAELKSINRQFIASLYEIKVEDISNITEFKPINAIKTTIIRLMPSVDILETDVYECNSTYHI